MSSALGRVAAASGPIDDAFATLVRRPEVISFAVGAPDPALLPGELIASLAGDVIAKYGNTALQYGLTQGFPPLLDQARILLSGRGIGCRPEQLHIATGGSGALHNVCMALLAPGSVVLVETPTYGPAVKVFRSHGATVVAVESDDRGIMPDALDVALALHDPAFVYLLPTFQNPTGRTMPMRRREQIAEVITRRGALVVEDDVYVDLRYWGEPLPAFWSFAPEHTVYITSLSKTLAPALRIGIAALTDNLRAPVFALKQGIDMQTSVFNQAIAAEFLASPVGSAHLDRIVAAYAAKLDTVVTALAKHFPAEFTWTVPDGGMFLWVDGPAGFDADALLGPALESGVAFLPGSAFFTDAAPRNAMRLSFAGAPMAEIDRGISVLARLCELP